MSGSKECSGLAVSVRCRDVHNHLSTDGLKLAVNIDPVLLIMSLRMVAECQVCGSMMHRWISGAVITCGRGGWLVSWHSAARALATEKSFVVTSAVTQTIAGVALFLHLDCALNWNHSWHSMLCTQRR